MWTSSARVFCWKVYLVWFDLATPFTASEWHFRCICVRSKRAKIAQRKSERRNDRTISSQWCEIKTEKATQHTQDMTRTKQIERKYNKSWAPKKKTESLNARACVFVLLTNVNTTRNISHFLLYIVIDEAMRKRSHTHAKYSIWRHIF